MVRKYTDKELLDKVQELESFTEFPKGYRILAVRVKQTNQTNLMTNSTFTKVQTL